MRRLGRFSREQIRASIFLIAGGVFALLAIVIAAQAILASGKAMTIVVLLAIGAGLGIYGWKLWQEASY